MAGPADKSGFPHSWLWGDHVLSDVTLLVYSAGDAPDGTWSKGRPEPVLKLPLHATVLASFSPGHYRNHLLRLWKDKGQAPPALEDNTPIIKQEQPAAQPIPIQAQQVLSAVRNWLGMPASTSMAADNGKPSLGRTGKRSAAEDDEPVTKRRKTGGPEAANKALELTCYPGEPHTVPEAVMRHAYTGALPDEPSLLAWMLWRADYLDVHGTVDACLAKLTTLSDAGQLSVLDVVLISSLPTLQARNKAAVEQAVVSMAGKVLPAQLGEARQVLVTEPLLEQFVQLPFQLLKQWTTLQSLKVDSENTMAVLLTAWYDHQLSSAGSGTIPTEQQCEELSSFLRLDKLSPSFHLQALPHLKWFRAPAGLPEQHGLARLLSSLDSAVSEVDFQAALASGGVVRQSQAPATAQQRWSLSQQQLDTLWEAAELELPGPVYFAGFCYRVSLELDTCAIPPQSGRQGSPPVEQRTLGVYVWPNWPAVLFKHGLGTKVPNPITALKVGSQVATASARQNGMTTSADKPRGWPDVLSRSLSRVEDLAALMTTPGYVEVSLSEAR